MINHFDRFKKWYILGSLIVIAVVWLFVPLVAKNLDYLIQKANFLSYFSTLGKNPNSSLISSIIILNNAKTSIYNQEYYFLSYEIANICICSLGALTTCSIIPFILNNKYKSLFLLLFFIPLLIFLFYIPYNSIYNLKEIKEHPILLFPNIGFYIIILITLLIIILVSFSIFKNKNISQSQRMAKLEKEISDLKKERD